MAKAKTSLPDLIARRSMLFGKEGGKADLAGIASAYFEAGRIVDALDFSVKAGDASVIDRIEEHAVKRLGGDVPDDASDAETTEEA